MLYSIACNLSNINVNGTGQEASESASRIYKVELGLFTVQIKNTQ